LRVERPIRSLHRAFFSALAVALATGACFRTSPDVTQGGQSLPVPSVRFPATAPAGSAQTAELMIENPGPGDIQALFVAFSRVGQAGGQELPPPIVDVVPRGQRSAVIDVEPEPEAVGDGVRFRFGPLEEGSSTTIRFELRVPEETGVAANSVQVYDGADPERSRGVLLETEVGAAP
jgi:hypothetical protein